MSASVSTSVIATARVSRWRRPAGQLTSVSYSSLQTRAMRWKKGGFEAGGGGFEAGGGAGSAGVSISTGHRIESRTARDAPASRRAGPGGGRGDPADARVH